MLDPADILLDRQPARDLFRVEGTVGGLAGEAQEIPRAVDEGVERVGLARGRGAALRAVDALPGLVALERIARGLEVDILGQGDRQAVLGCGHHAAGRAMDEGDRCPPIALAADSPVAQAPDGLARAPAFALGTADDLGLGLGHAHPVEKA